MEAIETIIKKPAHYVPKYFTDPTHPITISLIGAGGTGSLIIARLARLDFILQELGFAGIHVTVYDGDIVEYHNIGRQNFLKSDIGKFKASCLVEKVNFAYGLDWEAYNQFVGENIPEANITITAVDNADFRMRFIKRIGKRTQMLTEYKKMFYWLDCGNGKDFGQAILSTISPIEQPTSSTFDLRGVLPNVVDIYGNLNKYDTEETQGIAGCSVAESLEKQDVFINDAIALQACELVSKLIRNYRIDYHGVIINNKTGKMNPLPVKPPLRNAKKKTKNA